MHDTVYVGIAADKIKGEFNETKIEQLVQEVMKKYVEGTAKPEDVKCNYYVIGGRWEGSVAAIKGSENVLMTKSGMFAYKDMDEYDAVINNGQHGPYIVGDFEYIPINGGLKKNIEWNAISLLTKYVGYKEFELMLEGSPRTKHLMDGYFIKEGRLYAKGTNIVILRGGETFNEWLERLNISIESSMGTPDAYIDTRGIWHDENEFWAKYKANRRSMIDYLPDNPKEMVWEEYMRNFTRFIEKELKDDDCFVVLDCHR